MSRETKLDVLTLAALRGIVTPLPQKQEDQEQILFRMDDLGGVKLSHTPKEILEKALRYGEKGAKLTHIVVNRLMGTDTVISFVISDDEYTINSAEDLTTENGVISSVITLLSLIAANWVIAFTQSSVMAAYTGLDRWFLWQKDIISSCYLSATLLWKHRRK